MNISQLSSVYQIVIFVFVGLFFTLFAFRFYAGILKKSRRSRLFKVEGQIGIKMLKIALGLGMFLTVFWTPFYIIIGSAFRMIIPGYLNILLMLSIMLVAMLEVYLVWTVSQKLITTVWKKILLSISVLIVLPLSIYLVYYVPAMFEYPTTDNCYLLDPPVKGKWLAMHAGGNEIVNYHCAVIHQNYAMDIIKVDEEGAFYHGNGSVLEDYVTMNQEVVSPVQGTIVKVVDGLENAALTMFSSNKENPAGNHVVIEFEPDRYVFLAHLNKGSIVVAEGQNVVSGDPIGTAGNSGNTTMPHLHMHIQDMPYIEFDKSIGYPYRFKELNRKRWFSWQQVTAGFLIRNDVFSRVE